MSDLSKPTPTEPEELMFPTGGSIPNNSMLPLLLYRSVFADGEDDLGSALAQAFEANNWRGTWRNGVYSYHHFHSIAHEVLGVCSGGATLQLGGPEGDQVHVSRGDVIVIPAGVGHKRLQSDADFAVIGAYPEGRDYDLQKGDAEQAEVERNIAKVPLPAQDPLYGSAGPLLRAWRANGDLTVGGWRLAITSAK